MSDSVLRLTELDRGFRKSYLDYETLTAQLRDWANAFPNVVRLSSLGTTPEGRELWLLTIGPEPDRARPSVWVDGNMHASELAGSSVSLAIAEDAIRHQLDRAAPLRDVPGPALEALGDVLWLSLIHISEPTRPY